jgi:metal-responsive CopG/Arc/MetJ family transcriptional regulator
MRDIKVRLTDALYRALDDQARAEGNHTAPGRAHIVKKAVRQYLNRSGHDAATLNMSDDEYNQEGRRV